MLTIAAIIWICLATLILYYTYKSTLYKSDIYIVEKYLEDCKKDPSVTPAISWIMFAKAYDF